MFKVLAAGMNPVQIARGIEQTAKVLVSELNLLTREVYSVLQQNIVLVRSTLLAVEGYIHYYVP